MDQRTHFYVMMSGVVPALIAMWLVDRLDAKRPEPASLRRKVAIYGGLSCIPAIILELVIGKQLEKAGMPEITYAGASAHAFVVAAMVEEACKISVIYWVVWRRPEFDERMDGIVYASRAGLGFAAIENILYMSSQHDMGGAVHLWILRAVLAIPGHAMWTGAMGYFAARRRFDKWGPGLIGGYLLAVAGHGLYDYSVFVAQGPLTIEGYDSYVSMMAVVPPAVIIAFWLMMRHWARTALRLDDAEAARQMGGMSGGMPGATPPPGAMPPPGQMPPMPPPPAAQ